MNNAIQRRSSTEWRLAWRALRHVVWIRVALWRWPYADVRRRLDRRNARSSERRRADDVSRYADPARLSWAVGAAARRVPSASCLTQALALEALLDEAGFEADVRIGVARRPDGSFEAHAWVEHAGRVLIGDQPGLDRFSVLPSGAKPLGPL